jgi:hypothetical protein
MHQLPLPSPFTRKQALDAGVTLHQLHCWVRDNVIRRLLRSVYADADLPADLGLRTASLRLVTTPTSVVADRTAGWLHGVDTFAYRELEVLPPLEVCVLPEANRVRRQGVLGRTRALAPEDVMTVNGLRVTTPLRTTLDLGCLLRKSDALAALDGFMNLHEVTRDQLRVELPRYAGRRGVIQLRRLIEVADGSSESPAESWTRLAILDAGLPAPQLQVWVHDRGMPIFRLDLAYPKHRIAIEYDGKAFHDSPEQRARDMARRRWLRDQGWTVIVVTREDLMSSGAGLWLDQLADCLRTR